MTAKRLSNRDAYCAGCGYLLQNLTGESCPECGRRYDPFDPTTFLVSASILDIPCIGASLSALAGAAVLVLVYYGEHYRLLWLTPVMWLLVHLGRQGARSSIAGLQHTLGTWWSLAAQVALVINRILWIFYAAIFFAAASLGTLAILLGRRF